MRKRIRSSPINLLLWGCVSLHAYGPLVALEGYVNGQNYLELLQEVVKPEMDASRDMGRVLVFQQDNARPHKTAEVMEYLQNWGYEVIDWPPKSPFYYLLSRPGTL